MQDKYILAALGLVIIGVWESIALLNGINGAYLSMAIGAVAGIIGALAGISINLKPKS